MKVKLEMDEKKLKKFLRTKPAIKINIPNITTRLFSMITILFFIFVIIGSMLFYNIGYDKGKSLGYSDGYKYGEKVCLTNNFFKDFTLKQAITYHIKYNLVNIMGWLGLVIGLGWILHGVGFHIVK